VTTRRYADLFLSECRDHLALVNHLLLEWEREPASREPLDRIFRAVHTVKGMAATMGYLGAAEVSHRMENLLDALRRGAGTVNVAQLDLLFRAIDVLERSVAAGPAGGDADGRAALAAELDHAAAAASGGTAEGAPAGVGLRPSPAPEAARVRHVRVDLERLDTLMGLIAALGRERGRLVTLARRFAEPDLADVSREIARLSAALQREIFRARMVAAWQVFDRFPRMVRDLARATGRLVVFTIEGKETELDRAILDGVADPLVHLLRNAVDHGIESPEERVALGKPAAGRLVLSAAREGGLVAIRVSDDGRGIDRARVLRRARELALVGDEVREVSDDALLRLIARAGFSTAERVTSVSGRGVGIDVVAASVHSLGGALELHSESGRGTTFVLRLPASLHPAEPAP
jgi:two-component system chemotaxis sensor kinase CheA